MFFFWGGHIGLSGLTQSRHRSMLYLKNLQALNFPLLPCLAGQQLDSHTLLESAERAGNQWKMTEANEVFNRVKQPLQLR